MSLNIVLFEPEIPNNTGNIGRLTLASGSKLHLVKPLGFDIDDAKLKRAGLDYWPHLDVIYYDNIEAFFKQHSDKKLAFLSSHGTELHWEIPFEENMFLIFGKESVGLPKHITEKYKNKLYRIPLYSNKVRSLNLANAVSIIVYEGLRQLNLK
ncbi:tRNA (cytidine(34)-2'-O)-methyltransferase [Seonamhaeicola marinus]|uniref:Putative tRNA (cytidine(34)-2'-O)-methyltransferase n=1 Tax=Seonamhaeicola marinus TaxID=1912246 RepID=A0A5D0ITI3_9FLAO|nr:tRNA (cytidine(34)-2'-O)-methyltransferase [Seonamhaeicola marinus]TYA86826.1 tRNA (cytidine(34)-2'-O)-methyltransferase [Seonamhaeicola marinus]